MNTDPDAEGVASEDLIGFAASMVYDATRVNATSPVTRKTLVSMSRKLIMHIATTYHLFHKTPLKFEGREWSYPDISSIHSLVRIALENYAQLYEVFFEKESEDILKYRFFAFWLGSFQFERKPEKEQKLEADEKRIIEEIRAQIKNTEFFRSLKSKHQGKTVEFGKLYVLLEDGSIIVRSPSQILTKAGFHSDFVKNLVDFGNSNIHSDAFSAGQVEMLYSGLPPILGSSEFSTVILILCAKFISDYVEIFPEARQFLDRRPYIQRGVKMCLDSLDKINE